MYVLIEKRSKYMSFIFKFRSDRLGTDILSMLFQFYYCYKNKYHIKYSPNDSKYVSSIFVQSIFKLIDAHNNTLLDIDNSIVEDKINVEMYGGDSDMCYGMTMIVQEIESDMLSFFKNNFYESIKDYYNLNNNYSIPFDTDNSIVIHLRLDDVFLLNYSDYDGSVCSGYYINLINNNQQGFLSYGPDNIYNTQSHISSYKIEKELNKLLTEFPNSKIILIASPLTRIPELTFKYDMVIQSEDYNYDLFLLSKSKKIILSRSNYSLISLFFGEQTHVHMPLWGHFACAGFGSKYDKCKFNYFY